MRVIGVDGTSRGWVGAMLGSAEVTLLHRGSIDELFGAAGSPDVVAIDIPIGLAENGFRQADHDAREFLRTRRSTVFLPPVRAVLDHGGSVDYETANRMNRERSGKGLSRQAFALLRKIDEVERWRHIVDATVCEAHPEVSFQVLAGKELRGGKRTWNGAWERRHLLAEAGIAPHENADAGPAAVDDVLDAAVLAWTSRRVARGQSRTFPEQASPEQSVISA